MAVMMIGPEEKKQIQTAVEEARKNYLPWEVLKDFIHADQTVTTLTIEDTNKPEIRAVRAKYKPQQVVLGSIRCAFSYEEQKNGMVRHLSVSDMMTRNKYPNEFAVRMAAEEFGFRNFTMNTTNPSGFRMWEEEYEPGRWCINIIELEQELETVH